MTDSNYSQRPDAEGYRKVLEVLRRWDPIGVIDEQNQDEYDMYAADVVRLLDAGASADDLLKYMKWMVSERMGISFSRHHAEPFAVELVRFWTDAGK